MGKLGAFFGGLFTGILITAGGIAAAVAFVPTKTYLNAGGTQIVGEELGSRGLLDIATHINDIKVDDIAIIKTLLDNLVNDSNLSNFVTIDYSKIQNLALTDPTLGDKLAAAVTVTATLSSLNVDLGAFGNLPIFKEWTPVTPASIDVAKYPSAYYYQDSTGAYVRAYDDHGTLLTAAQGKQIYLANLSKVVVTDLFAGLSARLPELTVKQLFVNVLGQSESSLQDNAIYKLVGDKSLSELGNVDVQDFLLTDVLDYSAENKSLYDALCDLTGQTDPHAITIGMLSTIDFNKIHLSVFIDPASNAKLYDILLDIVQDPGVTAAEDITLKNLSNIDIGALHLSTVLSSGGNAILDRLLQDNTVTIGNLGAKINTLSLGDLYGKDAFTVNIADSVYKDTYYHNPTLDVYTYSATKPGAEYEDTVYYVSKNAGVWLMFCFDMVLDGTNGRAVTFSHADVTIATFENSTTLSTRFSEATIYNLIASGVIPYDDYGDAITRLTINGVLQALKP